MSGLIKLLTPASTPTRSGLAVSRPMDGRCQVRLGGRIVIADVRAAGEIIEGRQVVVAQTAEGWAVVGLGSAQGQSALEIWIEG